MEYYHKSAGLLSPEYLEREVERRKDLEANIEQIEEMIRVRVAFRTTRILMSPVQIKADMFLRQN